MTTASLSFSASCRYNLSELEHICICVSWRICKRACLHMRVQGGGQVAAAVTQLLGNSACFEVGCFCSVTPLKSKSALSPRRLSSDLVCAAHGALTVSMTA